MVDACRLGTRHDGSVVPEHWPPPLSFDDHEVVAIAVDDLLANLTLAENRVGGGDSSDTVSPRQAPTHSRIARSNSSDRSRNSKAR